MHQPQWLSSVQSCNHVFVHHKLIVLSSLECSMLRGIGSAGSFRGDSHLKASTTFRQIQLSGCLRVDPPEFGHFLQQLDWPCVSTLSEQLLRENAKLGERWHLPTLQQTFLLSRSEVFRAAAINRNSIRVVELEMYRTWRKIRGVRKVGGHTSRESVTGMGLTAF